MRKIALVLFLSLAYCGIASAQAIPTWPDSGGGAGIVNAAAAQADATQALSDAADAQDDADTAVAYAYNAQAVVLGTWLMDGDVTDGSCILFHAASAQSCSSANRQNLAIPSPGAHTLREFRCVADLNVIASGSFTMKLHSFDDDFTLTERASATGTYESGKTDKIITSGAISVAIPSTEYGYIVEMDAETTGTDDFELDCIAVIQYGF